MTQTRQLPFPFDAETAEFHRAFSKHVATALRLMQSNFVAEENIHSFSHGTGRRSYVSNAGYEDSEMKTHKAVFEIKFDDVLNGKIEALPELVSSTCQDMHRSIMRMMYSMLDEACQKSGQVVRVVGRESGAHAKAFLEMLQTIEFGIDQDGNPSIPQIHAGSQMIAAMMQDLKAQGPEFEKRVEEIKNQRIQAAREKERERKARFLRTKE